jgi:hypothetical protein
MYIHTNVSSSTSEVHHQQVRNLQIRYLQVRLTRPTAGARCPPIRHDKLVYFELLSGTYVHVKLSDVQHKVQELGADDHGDVQLPVGELESYTN